MEQNGRKQIIKIETGKHGDGIEFLNTENNVSSDMSDIKASKFRAGSIIPHPEVKGDGTAIANSYAEPSNIVIETAKDVRRTFKTPQEKLAFDAGVRVGSIGKDKVEKAFEELLDICKAQVPPMSGIVDSIWRTKAYGQSKKEL